ncbi:LOW QUALITY PROTEIN: hypothetical protein CVT25_004903 [Psilocybe cyanescens]|uniref:Uncharacterized protein n=1 Tax=Psilocybe cyanescens TaxID=93625 RepID=A0A409XMJ8_PSICY|nr:LOW QUALITY PROTEIN: hypothetical protein CVT25_004903 [Psilocybe cyanescens]
MLPRSILQTGKTNSFFWRLYKIKEEDILAVLYVNLDQTQLFWLLLMERYFCSKQYTVKATLKSTKLSMPATSLPNYDDTIKAGFKFEFSGTKTYWSNQATIIFPSSFPEGPLADQCLFIVQRSFVIGCVKTILIFSLIMCQEAAPVFINPAMLKSYHEDIINEFLLALNAGDSMPILKDTFGVLHNHSVWWLWNTYQMCCVWMGFVIYLLDKLQGMQRTAKYEDHEPQILRRANQRSRQ